jgi:hypothetical protein
VFTAEMLARAAETLPRLDRLAAADKPFVLFLEPPSLDDRIVNQFALFSLMSSPTAQMDPWLACHTALWHKLVIPAALKWEVRDKLDQANITERVLFPGLDGLSRWLKRYYSPRPEYAGEERTGAAAAAPAAPRPEEAPLRSARRADEEQASDGRPRTRSARARRGTTPE